MRGHRVLEVRGINAHALPTADCDRRRHSTGAVSVLWDLSFPLWAQAISTEEEIPVFIVYLTVVVGVTGLVGAAGL
jgi:hypothetical protein